MTGGIAPILSGRFPEELFPVSTGRFRQDRPGPTAHGNDSRRGRIRKHLFPGGGCEDEPPVHRRFHPQRGQGDVLHVQRAQEALHLPGRSRVQPHPLPQGIPDLREKPEERTVGSRKNQPATGLEVFHEGCQQRREVCNVFEDRKRTHRTFLEISCVFVKALPRQSTPRNICTRHE